VKTIFRALFAVAVLLSFTVATNAQTANGGIRGFRGPTTLIAGGTASVVAGATSNYTHAVQVPAADSFAFFASARPNGTNKVSLTFTLQPSLDQSAYGQHHTLSFTMAGSTNSSSANLVSFATNIQTGAIPYYRLVSILNNETEGYATNLTVKYGFKQ
jgi:hypothetical protein